VRYVLEGSVRKAGGRLRITGQLIEAASGAHLWAEKFDGALEEVFDLQDSITERVVAILLPKVHNAEIDRVARKRPDNLDGYDSVLRAHALLGKGNVSDIPEAISHLERAIQLVPNYALAHAILAGCYTRLYIAGANTDLEEERRKAVDFAHTAIELGNDDAEALAYAAFVLGNFEDWDGPQLAERSVSLNPNLAMGWFILGAAKVYRGDYEQALECHARALRLSPIGSSRVGAMASAALAHLLSDRYEQAYSWAERAYAENSDHPFAPRVFAMSAAVAGNRA
jgi:tetratricopeptide (TPR) repeat protein